MAGLIKGISAKSRSNSSEERSIELLSPNVHTNASTSCMVVSYSLANFTALSDSRKHSTNARQKVIAILGFLYQRRKLYWVTAKICFGFISSPASFSRRMQRPAPSAG